MDENLISNASDGIVENTPEGQVEEPGSSVDPYVERPHWVKRNAVKILLGIICILSFSLLSVLDKYSKEHEVRVRVQSNLRWLAFQHRDVRNERDFYITMMKDFNYYKFVKMIYEHRDSDFFETITIAYEESIRQNIDPWDTISIMWVESGFQQYVSSSSSHGLMQVNYNAWKDEKDLNMINIFDKQTNIRVGLEIYKYYLGLAHGDKMLAFFYYNNGTKPKAPNYKYAPAVMNSKYMKLAVNYQPIDMDEIVKGVSQ